MPDRLPEVTNVILVQACVLVSALCLFINHIDITLDHMKLLLQKEII